VFPVRYELNLYKLCRRKKDRLWSKLLATGWRCIVCCEVRIYICYVEESRPPLWSSGQSSWLQNRDVLPVRYKLNLYILCRRKQTASVV
jgi:hypothetical protein